MLGPHAAAEGRGENILVVEDEVEVLVKALLVGAGYTVIEAADGESAVECMSRRGGKSICC